MPIRKVKEKYATKDGRMYSFYQNVKNIDGTTKRFESEKFMTEEEAIEAEKAYLSKYKDLEVNPHMTFKEAYLKYYEYQKDKVKDSTLKTYRDRIKYMGIYDDVELVDLNGEHYQKWRNMMNDTDLNDRYKNDIQKFIKQVLNFAESQWDFNLRKFYRKMVPFKTPGALPKEMIFYTPEEFYAFIAEADDLRYRCLYKMLYYCGLRRSEARGLQWKHVDLFNKKISIKQQCLNPSTTNANSEWYLSSPKTPSSVRTLPITDNLADELKELRDKMKMYKQFKLDWFVFGDEDPLSYHQMNYYKDKYADKAGVKRLNLHGFRHSCASVLIHGSTPIPVVANYLGHSDSTETLETYTHMFEDDLKGVPKYLDTLLQDLSKKFVE